MAAAATEEDTELRDLLVQTLESSGVLNKIKVGEKGPPAGGERWLALAALRGPAECGRTQASRACPLSVPLAAGVPGWSAPSASRPGGGACFPRGVPRLLVVELVRGPGPDHGTALPRGLGNSGCPGRAERGERGAAAGSPAPAARLRSRVACGRKGSLAAARLAGSSGCSVVRDRVGEVNPC